MKEYGGYLPIESGCNELYIDNDLYQVKRLNAARYGIVQACMERDFTNIFLPYYLCDSVFDALEKNHINYIKYHINNYFEPIVDHEVNNSLVVIVNYYGMFGSSFYNKMMNRFSYIVFDNTQSFFSPPQIKNGVYNVYSPRKFVGVSDGAYLIGKSFNNKMIFAKDFSSNRCDFLFNVVEQETNQNYDKFLLAERDLCDGVTLEMSKLTHTLLTNIDYKRIKTIRNLNFKTIHKILKKYNRLVDFCSMVSLSDDICPMVYPLLLNKGKGKRVRDELINKRLYVSQWWKSVFESNESNEFEKWLSNDLIPVPIDQRYNTNDMIIIGSLICETILGFIK